MEFTMAFNNSKWIWINDCAGIDEYAEFYDEFEFSENAVIRLSCDSDYTLYVNGKYVDSNQFADFEHYKIYDEIDISNYLKSGKNTLSVLVWHFGKNTSRYKLAMAGLIYEIFDGEKLLAASGEATRARKCPSYESGRAKLITGQLGFGFAYDATREDGTLFTGEGFGTAKTVDKECTFYKRIGEKLRLAEGVRCKSITVGDGGRYHLVDLGEETVGLLYLKFTSPSVQRLRIDWGEDLQGGHVRRIIGERDFSVEYTAESGENEYINYMLRFGARYLEIWSEEPIELEKAGLRPQYYPTVKRCASLDDELDKRIYDLCVNTLSLSMMEHYVDCPWREQALYVFDSRNQMLSGYYAFEGGNSEYVKANLSLMLEDRRYNGLLSICYPTGKPLAIPSFSLHAFTAIREYYEHTGDAELLRKVYPKLLEIIKPFRDNIENGLVCSFEGADHWNFYDWSDYLDGDRKNPLPKAPDAVINFLYVIALNNLKTVCDAIGEEFLFGDEAERVLASARVYFYDDAEGAFFFREDLRYFTELANSLAIISGAVKGDEAKAIAETIIAKRFTDSSLSIKCFTYDALLMVDGAYSAQVIDEIRHNYKIMLDAGATSAWETLKGAADFAGAGSLCHGWSAIPVYYYHKLGMVK